MSPSSMSSPSSTVYKTPLLEMLSPYMAQVFFINTLNQMIQSILPIFTSVFNFFTRGRDYLKSYIYYDVDESDHYNPPNEFFQDVKLYLSNISAQSPSTTHFNVSRAHNSSGYNYGLSPNNRITDTFNGVVVTWSYLIVTSQNGSSPGMDMDYSGHQGGKKETCKFSLCLRKFEKEVVLPAYLDHVRSVADEIRSRSRERLLYTNAHGPWSPVPFKHPSTFDTLAIEPSKKEEIVNDLRDFADNGGAFYQRTGRAWKRGYLLYGPPGTGKSSMIAAMANYLGYDIYDLELTQVGTNSNLRSLLMQTTSKSIIVIEDIDCSVDLSKRGKQGKQKAPPKGMYGSGGGHTSITLSGLLNCTDGLWSCCGTERIFLFTTNHIENVDPALLRPGRMDMHIHMGYCTFAALKILMKNYLGFGEGDNQGDDCDELMSELEVVIDEAMITPADVSELLIQKRRLKMQEAVQKLLEELKDRVKHRREREEEHSNTTFPDIPESNEANEGANEEDGAEVKEDGAEFTEEMDFPHPPVGGFGFPGPMYYVEMKLQQLLCSRLQQLQDNDDRNLNSDFVVTGD